MKIVLFIMLLGVFILGTISPAEGGAITGLSLRNVTLYTAGLLLIMTEVLGGRLSRKTFTGLGFAIVILVAITASIFYAQYQGIYGGTLLDNFRSAKSLVFEPALLYGLAFLLIDTREQGERYLLLLIIVLGVLNCAAAIGAEFGVELFQVDKHYNVEVESAKRLTGFTGNPNKTAYLICVLAIFQYYFYKFHKSQLVRYSLAIIMVGELVVVLLSGSRGGLLVLVVVIMFLSYRLRDMKMVYAAVLLTPVLVGVLMISESSLISNAIDRMESLGSHNTSLVMGSRNVIWSALLSDYQGSSFGIKLFGNGFGASKYMGFRGSPHNMYLMVLVEFGVIGLGLFIYFIFSLFRRVSRARLNRDDVLRIFVLASGCVVVFAWIFTTLDGVLDFIWFTIGVAMATLFIPRKEMPIKEVPLMNRCTEKRLNS